MEGQPRIVATGGLAGLMAEVARVIEVVNADLTLEGLRILHERWQADRPRGGSSEGLA